MYSTKKKKNRKKEDKGDEDKSVYEGRKSSFLIILKRKMLGIERNNFTVQCVGEKKNGWHLCILKSGIISYALVIASCKKEWL